MDSSSALSNQAQASFVLSDSKSLQDWQSGGGGGGEGGAGAAGGLGGFFPPLILGAVRQAFGSYTIGFALLALTCLLCFVLNQRVLLSRRSDNPLRHSKAET